MVHHIQTFDNVDAFAAAYNKKEIQPPYLVTFKDMQIGTTPAGVPVYYNLYSNRLPWQEGDPVPARLSGNCVCGEWILGVSKL